jgi:hypothetical protein
MIEYRFRVPSAVVFSLYSYSKALEYSFRVPLRVFEEPEGEPALVGPHKV